MNKYITEIIECSYNNLNLTLKEPYEIPIALNPTIKRKIYKTKTLGWSLKIPKDDSMGDYYIDKHKKCLQSEILNEMKKYIVFKIIPQDFDTTLVASLNIGVNNETEEQIKNLRDSLEKSYKEQRYLEHINNSYGKRIHELSNNNETLIKNYYELNDILHNYKFRVWIIFILFVLVSTFILVCVR